MDEPSYASVARQQTPLQHLTAGRSRLAGAPTAPSATPPHTFVPCGAQKLQN